jgi:hypothetical protein
MRWNREHTESSRHEFGSTRGRGTRPVRRPPTGGAAHRHRAVGFGFNRRRDTPQGTAEEQTEDHPILLRVGREGPWGCRAHRRPGVVRTDGRRRQEPRHRLRPRRFLSSFYRWDMSQPAVGASLRQNPALLARPKRVRPYQTEATKAWTDEELRALTDVVRQKAAPRAVTSWRSEI